MTDLLEVPVSEAAGGVVGDGQATGLVRLLASCADQHGIVNAVSSFLLDRDANVVRCDQHTSAVENGRFYLRMEFSIASSGSQAQLAEDYKRVVADRFAMNWRMASARGTKRCAILVSQEDHCLLDLLWRWQRGELGADISMVVSNHATLRAVVESFGLPFVHIPVRRESREADQQLMAAALRGNCDVVVLARYMQILTAQFLNEVEVDVINIHHSFLPAFAGASPYRRAKERGVKLIGATAHYVTAELDEGPIIEQDIARVSHRDDVDTLRQLGADIERTVLARAVRWHCDDRLISDGNLVVVF